MTHLARLPLSDGAAAIAVTNGGDSRLSPLDAHGRSWVGLPV